MMMMIRKRVINDTWSHATFKPVFHVFKNSRSHFYFF